MSSIKTTLGRDDGYKPLQGLEDLEASVETEELIGQSSSVKRRGRSNCFYISTCVFALAVLSALSVWSPLRIEIKWANDSPIPQFPIEIVHITPNTAYSVPSDPESDELWNSNLPGTKGFVLLDKPEKYKLPPGLPSPNNGTKVYGVTWTHEYHCLKLIRSEFWKLAYANDSIASGVEMRSPASEASTGKWHHVQHCMDYIRQLIMCRADMTIEWASPEPDGNGLGKHINGYGIPHTCVKWDAMFDYMLDSQPPRYQKQAEKQRHELQHKKDKNTQG